MLHAEKLDAVTIATPIPFHYEMTRDCLERGLYVYLEKPPVPLLQQLDSLILADPTFLVGVGFQMIHSTCLLQLKGAVLENQLGEVLEIAAGGCWPRLDNYYARADWAGKMELNGIPVFDGPATNGLAHVIHDLMFLAGEGPDGFAVPTEVQGELYRARPIESYDVACLRGKFASGVRFSAALTHSTEETLPFTIEIRGTEGWARIFNDGDKFESSFGASLVCAESTQELLNKTYREFIEFIEGRRERVSTRLCDARGYVLATNAMLLSSGGIHDIPPESVRCYETEDATGFDVAGLRQAVEDSLKSGCLFSELSVPWAVATEAIDVEQLGAVVLSQSDFSRL